LIFIERWLGFWSLAEMERTKFKKTVFVPFEHLTGFGFPRQYLSWRMRELRRQHCVESRPLRRRVRRLHHEF
jgi:hypothetical protein